ncbi:MAG: alpha/beta hydrolase [Pseudomonadota bacterium]
MGRLVRILVVALLVTAGITWAVGYFVFGAAEREGPHAYAPVSEEQQAKARAYLAETGITPLPAAWQWQTFSPAEGIDLRTGLLDVAGERGTVLVIPGYTAPLDMMGGTVSAFAAAGYDVAGIEYRGQGYSTRLLDNPEKGHQTDYADLTSDIAAFVEGLNARNAGPVYIHAISMGGHIALRTAGERNPEVAAYSLVVPMVKIETGAFPYNVAAALSTFYASTGLGHVYSPGRTDWSFEAQNWGVGDACNSNAKTARYRDALVALDERLRVNGTTNGWVAATVASTHTITNDAFIAGIKKPVLMATAGKDEIVSTPAATAMCDALSDCRQRRYKEARHCIMQESSDREAQIVKDAVAFFEANGG